MAEQANPALIAEADVIALDELFRGPDQRLPARTIDALDQRRLDLRLGLSSDAAARELRRDHPGIVDDELVAGHEPMRQIADALVVQAAIRFDHEHPRGVTRARRAQCDVGGWKIEIEEIGAHGRF
jgi:hypothetical protein